MRFSQIQCNVINHASLAHRLLFRERIIAMQLVHLCQLVLLLRVLATQEYIDNTVFIHVKTNHRAMHILYMHCEYHIFTECSVSIDHGNM